MTVTLPDWIRDEVLKDVRERFAYSRVLPAVGIEVEWGGYWMRDRFQPMLPLDDDGFQPMLPLDDDGTES